MPVDPGADRIRVLLRRLWRHLSLRRRWQLGRLLLLMLLSSTAEVFSLAAIVPFLGVLAEPQRLLRYPFTADLADSLGFHTPDDLLLPFTMIFAAAALFAALVRVLNLWESVRLAAEIGSDLSQEAYRRTLYQPYEVHLTRNSSTVINTMVRYVGQVVTGVLRPLLLLFSSLLSITGLVTALLMIDWKLAVTAGTIFALFYGSINAVARPRILVNSKQLKVYQNLTIKALQEGLGAIRDVLLDGTQPFYEAIYRRADRPMRMLISKNVFLGDFPRYVMEGVGLLLIAAAAYTLTLQKGSLMAVVPSLGALALGAQRLIPAFQGTYNSWATINSFSTPLKTLLDLMEQPLAPASVAVAKEPLSWRHSILFEDVSFRYRTELPLVLSNIHLEIGCGERIGIIGETGSGKSTLVDLLMGLLVPSEGVIRIDGRDLNDDQHPELMAGWRAAIAHVPQSIFLADCSIAENVAFGVPRKLIDMGRVQKAAREAQIADFVDTYPEGYWTEVGERGIRMSGGQRQRIGIARARYKRASLLVFDEATSALDSDTEMAVMDSINALSRSLTLVIIAHRLTTLRHCDRVIECRDGRLYDVSKSILQSP